MNTKIYGKNKEGDWQIFTVKSSKNHGESTVAVVSVFFVRRSFESVHHQNHSRNRPGTQR